MGPGVELKHEATGSFQTLLGNQVIVEKSHPGTQTTENAARMLENLVLLLATKQAREHKACLVIGGAVIRLVCVKEHAS